MRVGLTALSFLATTSVGVAAATADERPIARVALDSRVAVSQVSFSEQVGEESRGDDLGRLSAGVLIGFGLQTSDVAFVIQGGLYTGGLSGDIADRYFTQTENTMALSYTIGGLARFERDTSRGFGWLGELHLGYSRMVLDGEDESAFLSSLFMEVAGGVTRKTPVAGLDSRVAVTLSIRAQRLRSLGATGLTESGVGVDDPRLILLPGLTVSTEIRF